MRKNLTYLKCDLNSIEELIDISRQTFIETYEKDNNPDDFANYMKSAFNHQKMKKELKHPNSEFHFIYLEKTLVGYFKLNEDKSREKTHVTDAMELARIYFFKQFQGQNYGSESLLKIIEIAKVKRKSWLWLSVWQHNEKVVRFYERHGFTKYDTASFYIGNDRQIDWLMRLDLV